MQDKYEDISVAFYYNNPSSDNRGAMGKGIEKMFKRGMKFWHTEIAFPGHMFSLHGSRTEASGQDRLFAFGVFSDQKDTFKSSRITHPSPMETNVHLSNDIKLTIRSQKRDKKTLKQNFYKTDIGNAIMYGKENPKVLVSESIYFPGPVDLHWNIPNTLGGRVSRYEMKHATLDCNYQTNMVQVKTPGMVFGKYREFSNPNYRWLHFSVPISNVIAALNFAKQQIGKPHDDYGTYKAMLFPGKPDYKSYYCVNFVASVLQRAGFLHGVNPNTLLPDDLYRLLSDHPDTITNINPSLLPNHSVSVPMMTPNKRSIQHYKKKKKISPFT